MYNGCPKKTAMPQAARAEFLETDGVDQESIARADTGKLGTAPLDWKETCYFNCPVVSASNVDKALGWVLEELRTIGVQHHHQGLFERPIAA
jgi:hypothetical protein